MERHKEHFPGGDKFLEPTLRFMITKIIWEYNSEKFYIPCNQDIKAVKILNFLVTESNF